MGLLFSKPIANITQKSSSSSSSSSNSNKLSAVVAVERYRQVAANQYNSNDDDATCETTINSYKNSSSSSSNNNNNNNNNNNRKTSAAAISIPPALVVAPTINLQIEESPINSVAYNGDAGAGAGASDSELSNIGGSLSSTRPNIIIKIQLAKMENGNNNSDNQLLQHVANDDDVDVNVVQSTTDLNANEQQQQSQQLQQQQQQQQLVNVNAAVYAKRTAGSSTEAAPKISAGMLTSAVAATSAFMINNNLNGNGINLATSSLAKLQMNDDDAATAATPLVDNNRGDDDDGNGDDQTNHLVVLREQQEHSECERMQENNDSAVVEYCEVLEPPSSVDEMLLNRANERAQPSAAAYVEVNTSNSCCRNRFLSKSASAAATMTATGAMSQTSKRRCTKCKCRDVFRGLRGMLESSSSSASTAASKKNKEAATAAGSQEQRTKERKVPCEHRHSTPAVPLISANASAAANRQQQRKRNSIAQIPNTMPTPTPMVTASTSSAAAAAATAATIAAAAATATGTGTGTNAPNQLSIWAPSGSNVGDVIIHISTPQFVVSQCANRTPLVTVGCINETPAISVMATTAASSRSGAGNAAAVAPTALTSAQARNQVQQQQPTVTLNQLMRCNQARVPIVHSQIDFVHYLVPDLERITNSSFYWGKMDRYEAERLLEGLPEGTFLLRDSAQEEFLFSVTFRKYERSLHARIEQSGHKFSFDCHDPCVHTATTVTGLLEHYKDPSCVMFFEPMLTIPLHRKNPFSLQQLCRATIVSNTTYDGINQLELPARLKSYMKEYHYKQKLRVKPFDDDEPFYSCT